MIKPWSGPPGCFDPRATPSGEHSLRVAWTTIGRAFRAPLVWWMLAPLGVTVVVAVAFQSFFASTVVFISGTGYVIDLARKQVIRELHERRQRDK